MSPPRFSLYENHLQNLDFTDILKNPISWYTRNIILALSVNILLYCVYRKEQFSIIFFIVNDHYEKKIHVFEYLGSFIHKRMFFG